MACDVTVSTTSDTTVLEVVVFSLKLAQRVCGRSECL